MDLDRFCLLGKRAIRLARVKQVAIEGHDYSGGSLDAKDQANPHNERGRCPSPNSEEIG